MASISNPGNVPVVIWCGGKGTRLREETEYKPKPMVEVGGKPILWHIMKIYSHYGFHDFVLPLGYRGNVIREYFANYGLMNSDVTLNLGSREVSAAPSHEEMNWNVTLVDTGQEAMTGARLRKVKRYVDGGTFLATYGDAVSNLSITELLDFHRRMAKQGKIATVTGTRPPSRFGQLQIEGDSVVDFVEKPKLAAWVNGGFFAFEPSVFDYLDDSEDCVFEKKPLERLAKEKRLAIYKHDGFWLSVDTYKDFLDINEVWAKSSPWKVWK